MIDCGHVRESSDGSLSACWIWADCPHQPYSVYEVWQYTRRGDNPKLIGTFQTFGEARQFEHKQDPDRWTDVRRKVVTP